MAFLIDKYLLKYNFNEYHDRLIVASAKECFLAAKNLNLSKSFITKMLLKLRGLPAKDLHLQAFLHNMCFTYLEENPFKEFVIDASQLNLKMMWNFYFKEVDENNTLVSTETRVLCLTKKSKILFSLYWFFIKPFSGIIRMEMLKLIKQKAESN
jgi:hypothetical protein